jgi:uncharacterized protein YndB with AHSA1/START domain
MSEFNAWPAPMDRVVRQTGRSRGVGLRRRYDTTMEDMWEAWTSPDRLRRWLGEVSGDLAEGGTVLLNMAGGEPATCTIIRCDAPHRLVATWSDAEVSETAVELRLRRDGDRTLVELEHLGFDAAAMGRVFGEGWEDFLFRLGQHVAGMEPWSRTWEDVRATLDPYWNPLAEDPAPDGRWPTVTVDGARADLAAHRTYGASQRDVWAALTDPKRLAVWFADVEVDGDRKGTSWRAVFTNGVASGTIRSCVPEREIVTTWKWDHQDSGSVLYLTLEPVTDGTLVRLEQRDAPSDGAGGYGAGWYAMLAGLGIHLDGRKPTEADWEADFALARHTVQPFHRSG